MSKISVIIPIYNALNDVKILLESLLTNFNFNIGEIILVNDCSLAETTDYLNDFAKEHTNFKLINNEENFGFVKSCNKGIKASTGDIVVLLNSDTKIPAQFCERIIKCFDTNPKVGVASPISSHSGAFYIPFQKNFTLEQMNERLRKNHKCSYPLIHAAEGFCFCIRKQVIEQQGYLDEIYGKGYHEEIDFSYRAITNGWKNVLIDDLYVYHKRHASFGIKQREKQIQKNDAVFLSRWEGFKEKYEKEHNLKNPINKIKREMFPFKTFFSNLFSIKNSYDKRHKIVTILGVKVKIKVYNYPKKAKFIKKIFNKKIENGKNIAAILAIHSKQCILEDNLVKYIKEIKKHVGYLVIVSDCPMLPSEIEKIKNIVDAAIFEKHNEYDFGSYKRGFLLLKKIKLTEKLHQIVFLNDSVLFVGNNLNKPFDELKNNDYYGITQHLYGYNKVGKNYDWIYSPHIQSYFFSVSFKIFNQKWFYKFIKKIKHEKHKKDVIVNYEIGLSKLISSKGFKQSSLYANDSEEDIDPCELHLKKENADLLIKKKFL